MTLTHNHPDTWDQPDRQAGPQTRQLPHDLQAEESLLGAMLLTPTAIAVASEHLTADHFYKPAHAHIYTAITTLADAGHPVDVATVADHLRRADLLDTIGGPTALVALQSATPATSNAGRYATIVADHHHQRHTIATLTSALDAAWTWQDPTDQLEALLDHTPHTQTVQGVHDALDSYLDELEQRYEAGEATGIRTGLTDLDTRLSGLRDGQLIVIAGRPGMGKSAVGAHIAIEAAGAGHRVLIVSVEMATNELLDRFVASRGHVIADRIRSGKLTESDWQKIGVAVGHLAELPLWLVDDPDITLTQIRGHARRLDADLVIVDYMQLLSLTTGRPNDTREREVAELSRGLKVMARTLHAPVIALSQLNRNVETRHDKRPMLADLRESGSIENDADAVIGLYRDEYYHPDDSPDKGLLELITLKQRGGPTGTDRVAWLAHWTAVANMARSYNP